MTDRPSTDLLLDASGVAKRYGAVAALRRRVAAGAAGRGPRPARRQRRGQEHPRQDPHRRRPAGCGHVPRGGRGARHPLPVRSAPLGPGVRLPGARAHPGPRHQRQPAAHRAPRPSRSGTGSPSSASRSWTWAPWPGTCRSPGAAHRRPGSRARARAGRAAARRDDRRAPRGPHREGARGRGPPARHATAPSSSSRTGSSRSTPSATAPPCCATARPWASWTWHPAPSSRS